MDDRQDDQRGQKRFGTIPQWIEASGMGRTSTYQEIAAGNIRAVKQGNRTLIDFLSGWRYLDSLPAVKIRRQPRKRPNGHHKDQPTNQP
jgi:hypothetical protein